MKALNFLYCCAYYYVCRALEEALLLLAVLMGCFIIHKLVSWAIWVMSL